MIQRLAEMCGAFAGLLETKARLVARDLEQAGALFLAYLGAVACGIIGLGLVLAAMIVVLANQLGTPGALAVVGAATISLGAIVLLVARRAIRRGHRLSRDELECLAALHRDRLTSGGTVEDHPLSSIVAKVADALTEDPRVLGSGAFAAFAVLGPRRVLRLANDAASVASFTASVTRLMHDLSPQGTHRPDGSNPRPGADPDPCAPHAGQAHAVPHDAAAT